MASYTVTAQGGSQPLAWSVKSGVLPEGFALSKDGIISGRYILPSDVSKKIFPEFTLEVKDQLNQTKTVILSITVVPEAPKITTVSPSTLTVGESYDEVIATASGGIPPYKFGNETASGPIPIGMQITAVGNQAHLVGSPKAKGNFSFRVCVIDSTGTSKCGGAVEFAVQETAVVAPKDKYDSYEITEDVLIKNTTTYSWQTPSCPANSWLSGFAIYNGTKLKVANLPWEGNLDSSGFVSVNTGGDEILELQLYGSGKGSYLKGTNTHGWGGTESCTYSITAPRVDEYSNY
jgi:hypothetical protein